jgi:Tfp pilus assembly protein PilZ
VRDFADGKVWYEIGMGRKSQPFLRVQVRQALRLGEDSYLVLSLLSVPAKVYISASVIASWASTADIKVPTLLFVTYSGYHSTSEVSERSERT